MVGNTSLSFFPPGLPESIGRIFIRGGIRCLRGQMWAYELCIRQIIADLEVEICLPVVMVMIYILGMCNGEGCTGLTEEIMRNIRGRGWSVRAFRYET